MTMGLGVVVDGSARFYPHSAIEPQVIDDWNGQTLQVDGVPRATWADSTRPLQYFLSWYGFALTFSHCNIYGLEQSVGKKQLL